MSISKADQKRRIVLPHAKPGEVFEVREDGADAYRIIRLRLPPPPAKLTAREVADRLRSSPLRPRMSSANLLNITRED
jgi:hypothetical protein